LKQPFAVAEMRDQFDYGEVKSGLQVAGASRFPRGA
jgi:hypothetical protein